MKKLYISPDLKWNVINAKEDILIGSGEDMDNLCRFVNMKKEIQIKVKLKLIKV